MQVLELIRNKVSYTLLTINFLIKQKNKTTWTIKATGMLKVCSILRIVTDVNFYMKMDEYISYNHLVLSYK
jgi:hypothetical protein